MGIVLSYAFAHIIEAVILWMSMSQMYEHRYKQWLTGTIIMLGHAVMFAVFLMGNIYFITIVNIMTYIVLIYVLFFVTKGSALFWTAIYIAFMALSEQMVFFFIEYIIGITNVKLEGLPINLVVVCLSKMCYLVLVELMVLIKNKSKISYYGDMSVTLLIVILIATLLVFMTYYIIEVEWSLNFTETVWIVISSIVLVLSDLLVLWVNIGINKRNAENERMKVQLEKEKSDAKFYKLEYEKNESLEILRHDMNNHLNTILAMGNNQTMKDYIIDIMNEYSLGRRTTFSNNNVLNGLISQYVDLCNEDNIKLLVDIRPETVDSIASTDIVSLFGNILSNAYEAVRSIDNIEDKFIELIVKRRNNAVLIVETNSCVRQPKMQNGRFISNKKDPYKRHGFGIKSIQKVVEKYMGSYVNKYDESKQEFIVSIMLMDK